MQDGRFELSGFKAFGVRTKTRTLQGPFNRALLALISGYLECIRG